MKYVYCLDLGTNYIKIIDINRSKYMMVRDAVAIKNGRELYAVGDDAAAMFARSPQGIEVHFPMKNGVISDFNYMAYMLEHILKDKLKIKRPKILDKQIFIVAVPTDISEVEKRAFFNLAQNISIRTNAVGLVDRPLADAAAMGIDVTHTAGTFIVDMGADSTDFAGIVKGGVAINKICPVGGQFIDSLLEESIKKKYNVILGHEDIEDLKINLGDAIGVLEEDITLYGTDFASGRPVEVTITSEDVYEVIKIYLEYVVKNLKATYQKLQPQIREQVKANGIYVTGGLSGIPNLKKYLKMKLGVGIHVFRNPERSVVRGLQKIYEDPELNTLIYSLQK